MQKEGNLELLECPVFNWRCFLLLVFLLILASCTCSKDFPQLKLGCYKDASDRDMGNMVSLKSSNSPTTCMARCSQLGFLYTGLQYSYQCFCGNSYGKHGQVPGTECQSTCSGDSSLFCGASWRSLVYCVVPHYERFLGCYKESHPSDLWGLETNSDNITLCIQTCQSNGYPYAAVQNNSRCTCGVSYGRYGKASPFVCKCSPNSNAVYRTDASWEAREFFYGNVHQSPPLTTHHVIYTDTTDLYSCVNYCEKIAMCKSINYNHLTRACEFNNVTSSEGRTHARHGYQYYERVGDIY